jgi:anti-sigma factor RsiW
MKIRKADDTAWVGRIDERAAAMNRPAAAIEGIAIEGMEGDRVRNLIGWTAAWVAGAAGWWLGGRLGLAAAVAVSAIAGGVGLYYGYRWFDENLK